MGYYLCTTSDNYVFTSLREAVLHVFLYKVVGVVTILLFFVHGRFWSGFWRKVILQFGLFFCTLTSIGVIIIRLLPLTSSSSVLRCQSSSSIVLEYFLASCGFLPCPQSCFFVTYPFSRHIWNQKSGSIPPEVKTDWCYYNPDIFTELMQNKMY